MKRWITSTRPSSPRIRLFVCLILSFSGIVGVLLVSPSLSLARASAGTTYYVSKNGNNSGGTSWTSAWTELDRITWPVIQPGDTILIDGGTNGMTYLTTLSIEKSGTAGAPITIERATTPGHNGLVRFFGGNTQLPPACGQAQWNASSAHTVPDAVDFNGHAWITMDGQSWDGIRISGFTYRAIFFSGGESHISMGNLEVDDNGGAFQSGGVYYPQFAGVTLHGTQSNLSFQSMNLHDNGVDNFNSSGGVTNFMVQNSMMYDTRSIPGQPSNSFNECVHNDGFQIFGSTPSSGITFQHDIFGPGLTNGLIFQPLVTNVTLSDSLILDPGSNVTVANSGADHDWHVDHVTSIGQSDNLTFEGGGNSITNSILYDGNLLLNQSIASSANNCEWNTRDSSPIQATRTNPGFATNLSAYLSHTTDITQFPTLSVLLNGNFASSASACTGKGSSITSVSQFLQTLLPATPTPKPTSTPTQSPVVLGHEGPRTSNDGQSGTESTVPPVLLFLAAFLALCLLASAVVIYRRVRHRKKA